MDQRILVIGSGGREHAIAWKIKSYDTSRTVFVSPGNPGMIQDGIETIETLDTLNFLEVSSFCLQEKIDLVIIGPEKHLTLGIIDYLQSKGIKAFGPNKEASLLEGSKLFAKEIMRKGNVPTAKFFELKKDDFTLENIKSIYHKNNFKNGLVVKLDGLASGKGVYVLDSINDLELIYSKINEHVLELNQEKILIEERLQGREVSCFYLCNGEKYQFLSNACDYKRIFDENKGPNTGGMGCYSPVEWVTQEDLKEIEESIILPTLISLKENKIHYKGFLFAGLMKTNDGFKVIEYNVRLGDPETQTFLPLLKTDLLKAIENIIENKQSTIEIEKEKNSIHVILSSKGYPGSILKENLNKLINQDDIKNLKNKKIFFSGVKRINDSLVTSGGRVMGVTALEKNKCEAVKAAYSIALKDLFEGAYCRKDIGTIY